jgi:hypothetical protein
MPFERRTRSEEGLLLVSMSMFNVQSKDLLVSLTVKARIFPVRRARAVACQTRFWKLCIEEARGSPQDGLGALIIRTYGLLADTTASPPVSFMLRDVTKMNILVATPLAGACRPGRLLQHMDQTVGFDCDNLQMSPPTRIKRSIMWYILYY